MTDTSNIVKHPATIERDEPEARRETRAESTGPTAQPQAATDASQKPAASEIATRRRLKRRRMMFSLLPLALVVGGYFYVTGGRYVSTDNAYVQADMVGISTDVSGLVAGIDVHENELVKAGQVLFRLKPDSFAIALEGAQAELGHVRNQILALQASYQQSLAEITQAEADLPFYQATFKRQQDLVATSASSRATFDQAKHDLDAAKQKVAVAKAQAQSALAELGGNADQPVEQNPLFLQAKAKLDEAQRQLDDATVRAPFDGIVTNVNSLQVGSYLQAAQQAFSLVSSDHLWITANPKETELTGIEPGQPVTISVDTYPDARWEGKVASISPASGSSFSLLPAQNTSGNWVKVVQRIPMRVSIDNKNGQPPLRVGMSVNVEVDTGHSRGLPRFITNLFGGGNHV
ncbi:MULTISPECIES: HlyD family secretion protein [Brucella]|uniref:Multidrug resistance protein A n=1 Tax=Ochrobactrum soli TaxID=2448455 RepID=A0A2P9HF81_9HYPH|nr:MULTISPECIES: HlyD family secretion protein [Brucella]RRD26896.1 HlyD family secretion protein [Brucellaceae bacterium VT-16-1752]WHT43569.1 HlyD family secretion protein [Ochrobactrum sp. SSR]MDX4072983.1 HlyD family secretion protein [Brucella sp. NBRC 113783]WHS33468.1 HlyD family secretion protein [Brucella sp. NM4]SPL62758.1 Multidrug resistance protein A [[Ochrobactrum] soli]